MCAGFAAKDMESHGRSSEQSSLNEISKQMASSASGSAFEGFSIGLGSVQELLDDPGEPSGQADAAASDPAAEPAEKEVMWLNDQAVARAIRVQTTWATTVQNKFKSLLAQFQSTHDDITAAGAEGSDLRNELAIAQTRTQAAEHVALETVLASV